MLNLNKKGIPVCCFKNQDGDEQIIYLKKDYIRPVKKVKLKKTCEYCRKEFYGASELRKHLASACKKKDIEQFKEFIIRSLKNELDRDDLLSMILRNENGDCIEIDNDTMIPLPRKDIREIIYVAGCQGSGKSYYTAQYLNKFAEHFPDHNMFLFSRIENDTNFEKLKGEGFMIPINIDTLLDEDDDPIDCKTELLKSICIFDDIETMDTGVTKYLELLRNDVIKNGRDQALEDNDIYCISTSHQLSDYKKTRDLLNECTSITIFPRSGGSYGLNRVLKLYFGLAPKQIKKIKNLPSRWVTLYSGFPQYVVHQRGCYLLS